MEFPLQKVFKTEFKIRSIDESFTIHLPLSISIYPPPPVPRFPPPSTSIPPPPVPRFAPPQSPPSDGSRDKLPSLFNDAAK